MQFQIAKRWRWRRRGGWTAAARQAQGVQDANPSRTLAGVEPGREVSVIGYIGNSTGQRRHLQAYGLLPGRRVRVLAQQPVTIVLIEQTELAFEGAVAASVLVGD